MDSGKVKEIEEGSKKRGKYFGGGVEGYGKGSFKKGDVFKYGKWFFGSGKKMVFDEEVST